MTDCEALIMRAEKSADKLEELGRLAAAFDSPSIHDAIACLRDAAAVLKSSAEGWRPIQDDEHYSPRIEALAESWASIDGKTKHLALCRLHKDAEEVLGHYEGYMAEARTMIERLEKRGFTVTPIPSPPEGR